MVAPVEDEIVNGLVPAVPRMLKVTVDEVALMPATVPLSAKRLFVRDVGDVQRARNPLIPPERLEIPSVDVATQRVEVPVVWSTMPRVPVALRPSRNHPERLRLVVVALVIVPLVAKSVVIVPTVVDDVLKTD